MMDHMYLMLYNLLWTSLPPVALGIVFFVKIQELFTFLF